MSQNAKHEIRLLTPADYEEWDRFIRTAPGGSVLSSTACLGEVARASHAEVKIWGVYRKGELVAGTGLLSRSPLSMVTLLRPIPLAAYASVAIKPRGSRQEAKLATYRLAVLDLIAQTLKEEADGAQIVGDTELTDIRPFSWRGWKSAVLYTYMLDISDPARLWDRCIDRNIRNRVRKCRDCGIEIKRGSDVKILYEIISQTLLRHHATMSTNEEMFCGLCRELIEHDRFIIYFAEAGSEVVCAYGVVKDYRGMLHLLVGGTRPDYLEQGPASHLLWTMIEDFAEEGFEQIDLNGANIPSIAQFKSRLGGELKPYFEVFTENRKARLFNWGWQKASHLGVSDWLRRKLLYDSNGRN